MTRKKQEHESYAVIGASRVTCGGMELFESSIKNTAFIELRIKKAYKYEELGRAWVHGNEEIVAVRLSAARFAEMITSLNHGDGVPCTLVHVNGKRVEMPPEQISESRIIQKEFKKTAQEIMDGIEPLNKRLDEILAKPKIGKSDKIEIKNLQHKMQQHMSSNLPWYAEQFEKSANKAVHKAKMEIDAHVNKVVYDTGIEHLKDIKKQIEKVED